MRIYMWVAWDLLFLFELQSEVFFLISCCEDRSEYLEEELIGREVF